MADSFFTSLVNFVSPSSGSSDARTAFSKGQMSVPNLFRSSGTASSKRVFDIILV